MHIAHTVTHNGKRKRKMNMIGINRGSWGHDPEYLNGGTVRGVAGSPWNIFISYNVQEYETRSLSKVITLEIERCVYTVCLIKFPWKILLNLCAMCLSLLNF